MSITVAKGAGFCFGVKRAYKILRDHMENRREGDILVTLGSFVHNPQIIEKLRSEGVPPITESELDPLIKSANADHRVTVLLRTHGVSKQLAKRLKEASAENEFFTAVDCTCPCVAHIHGIVEKESSESSDDTLIVIIGNANHPEVVAITSYCECEYKVFGSLEELKALKTDKKRIVCVAQTTQKLTECKLCQKHLLKHFTFTKIYDTICKVTEERQTEVEKLARISDMMLIIGGRESSNTNKLFEISKHIQPNTFFVEQISEIPLDGINPNTNIGISAGASTPDGLIEEAILAMSDIIENKNENFAELLAESEFNTPRTGAVVKGTVASINDREVLVDLAANLTGFIKADEFDDDENLIKVGDEIEAVVVKKNDAEGTVILSKKQADSRASKGKIEEAFNNGEILEGKVVELIKKDEAVKGVIVSALHTKFFVPASQTGVAKDGDVAALLGTTQQFKITELGAGGKRTVASISIVEKEKKAAEIEEFWSTLCEGKVFEGTVKSMTDYGVFVNIGPIDGMVHKTELSWKRFRIPSDIVSVGDKLTVYIKDLNPEKKRISLGCKTAENNPWNIFVSQYKVEDVVSVKIANIMTYGAFAEIIDGVDGLIHISQIANKRLGNPAEVLHTGDVVDAKIIDIDTENKKVSLSIRALLDGSEAEVEDEDDDGAAIDTTDIPEEE